jgi:hypothetical protein
VDRERRGCKNKTANSPRIFDTVDDFCLLSTRENSDWRRHFWQGNHFTWKMGNWTSALETRKAMVQFGLNSELAKTKTKTKSKSHRRNNQLLVWFRPKSDGNWTVTPPTLSISSNRTVRRERAATASVLPSPHRSPGNCRSSRGSLAFQRQRLIATVKKRWDFQSWNGSWFNYGTVRPV